MPDSYPYTISNNKIDAFFTKIREAARPDRLSHQVLKHWGFTASNDRALIAILKGLGFLDENGAPTELYSQLQGDPHWKNLLGQQIRHLYSELYATNRNIHNSPEDAVKGAFSRITGKDATLVGRYYSTFKTLAGLAKFDGAPEPPKKIEEPIDSEKHSSIDTVEEKREPTNRSIPATFHYNIQIHLPATNDISVYNAIFKSLKENLDL